MMLGLQIVALAALGWAVPCVLAKALPEGAGWLIVNAVAASAVLAAISVAGFIWLYGAAGGEVWQAAPWHFVLLSGKAAIVWAPVMILSLANLPRGWKEAVW